MRGILAQITPRHALLLAIIAVLLVYTAMLKYQVLPAFDEQASLRAAADEEGRDYAKLRRDAALKQSVDAQFAALKLRVEPEIADETALAEFFQAIETKIRERPAVRVVNMKPQPVQTAGAYKDYHIKLVVAGKLQDVVQLVSDLANGPLITGLDGFCLRGVQGLDAVECSLTVFMIRLVPEAGLVVPAPAAGFGKDAGE